jgi:hypothetical protein
MTPTFTDAEREFIRDDVIDAVLDALALQRNPAIETWPWEDWSAFGTSDPVHLAPLELEF